MSPARPCSSSIASLLALGYLRLHGVVPQSDQGNERKVSPRESQTRERAR